MAKTLVIVESPAKAQTIKRFLGGKFDVKAMSEAVPDALVEEIAIAGTPDEARDQLAQWQGLTEQPLLYAPSVGVPPERIRANVEAMFDLFGGRA